MTMTKKEADRNLITILILAPICAFLGSLLHPILIFPPLIIAGVGIFGHSRGKKRGNKK